MPHGLGFFCIFADFLFSFFFLAVREWHHQKVYDETAFLTLDIVPFNLYPRIQIF